ncbi:rare lipoprotein A [Canicola haemoglobinophilus]|uniref:Endolytic peptidoglycan transglycosylase RlpA n=2 Tax=Canicola haemoglobinophilus TaxID=733 RepID=A0AB38H5U2_9PAST|nr:rare lipoprotein A [Canicola haemoglobinophilus]STO67684.1 rare lipoprotein A [Canicola haemoglobinophilus]
MMKSNKTFKLSTALFMAVLSLSTQANTKKLYGIEGPQLTYQKPADTSHIYVVKGVKYTTKTHNKAKNYSKEGIASFYHNKFHGRKTANGEIFNNNAYTAAHKTLPLNSYVLVTNLRNNRKVIVRINDRGPFSKGRIIDLSRAAAKELGIIRAGTGKVKIESLHVNSQGKISGPATKTLAKTSKNDRAREQLSLSLPTEPLIKTVFSGYKLKMLNLASKQEAEKLMSHLKQSNIPFELEAKGKKYDIIFGPLENKEQIKELKDKLQKLSRTHQFIVFSYNEK